MYGGYKAEQNNPDAVIGQYVGFVALYGVSVVGSLVSLVVPWST